MALLTTSKELENFNITIKDLLKSKKASKRQEQWEQASLSECWMKAMTAFQKQKGSWLSFDHQIAMIYHFKLDLGAADAYMTLEQPVLHRLWMKKQLTDMQYVVDEVDDKGEPVVWLPMDSLNTLYLDSFVVVFDTMENCKQFYFIVLGDEWQQIKIHMFLSQSTLCTDHVLHWPPLSLLVLDTLLPTV